MNLERQWWYVITIIFYLLQRLSQRIVNFTNYFENKKTILQLLSIYFFGYAIVWFVVILVSPSFPNNFINLGQWMLLLTIGGLTKYGTKKHYA